MKLLFNSILLVMLSFTTYGQNDTIIPCDSCDRNSREVINLGIDSWRAEYKELSRLRIIESAIPHTDTVSFSRLYLDSIYGNTIDSTSTGTIIFRYYLESLADSIPKIAITNCATSDSCLISENGAERIVSVAQILTKFENWARFLGSQETYLIYVTSYSYCWSKIGKGLQENADARLYIENLAHTVSPLDTNYLLPLGNGIVEGYVAFDLAIAFNIDVFKDHRGSLGTPSLLVDFAVPCPKACPQNK